MRTMDVMAGGDWDRDTDNSRDDGGGSNRGPGVALRKGHGAELTGEGMVG